MGKAKDTGKGAVDLGEENTADVRQNENADGEVREDNITFEASLEELELLVDRLERGQLLLDESLELFEKGMKLARICNGKLSKAERRIEMLIEENGSLKTGPFMDE